MKKTIQTFIIAALLAFFPLNRANAQLGIASGGNISNVRHNNLLVNEQGISNNYPLVGSFFGLSFQFYPIKTAEKISFTVEFMQNLKGYKQKFSDYTFVKTKNYLTFPMMANYDINDKFSVYTGAELSTLMRSYTPLKLPDNTYNDFDLGIILGANYKIYKNWNVFTRMNFGVLPTLNYYKIDAWGNITPTKDVKNINLMIGIKINIIHEKIKFY